MVLLVFTDDGWTGHPEVKTLGYYIVSWLDSKKKKKQGKVYLTEESKMAVGGFAVDGHATGLNGKMTVSVVITCIVAATSGLIFGYDVGISGPFLSICFLQISY